MSSLGNSVTKINIPFELNRETDLKIKLEDERAIANESIQIVQKAVCLNDDATVQTLIDGNVAEESVTQDSSKEIDLIIVTEDGQTFKLDNRAFVDAQSKDGLSIELDDTNTTYYALIESPPAKKKSCTTPQKTYKCPTDGCDKFYSSQHHLKVHMRIHTGDRPFACGIARCNKTFTTKYGLTAHVRTHTGEKPYKCRADTCSKSFKTSGDLQKHLRTHTGERPFKCSYPGCSKSFTTSNIRKVHLRTHTGERPYRCLKEDCGRTFSSATNYKNHLRIHTGEKPYQCSVQECGKRFTEYSSLYKHSVVHSSAKPFTCFLCGRNFKQTNTLMMHKKCAHGIWENPDGTHVYVKDMPKEDDKEANENDTVVVIAADGAFEALTSAQQTMDELSSSDTHILVLSDSQLLSDVSVGTNTDTTEPSSTEIIKLESPSEIVSKVVSANSVLQSPQTEVSSLQPH